MSLVALPSWLLTDLREFPKNSGEFDTRGFADVLLLIWPVLQDNHMLWAAICLLLLQAFDWGRDIRHNGLGFAR